MSTTVEEIEKIETRENKKDELLLDSLEIKGYRCFEHLTIEKLGRVNLIVGKNNVGKTALLEVLRSYAEGRIDTNTLLQERNETPRPYSIQQSDTIPIESSLFSDRLDIDLGSITIGKKSHLILDDQEISLTAYKETGKSWKIQNQNRNSRIKNLYINTNGITSSSTEKLWDNIELTDLEKEIIKTLKLILPELENVGLKIVSKDSIQRFPYVKIEGQYQPLPLRSFGDGINRLFGLALALANCSYGILMIDEIENGFHYSVLPDVWKLIFKTARDLNVQVFATTHSKDCLEAFMQAAIEDEESDGILIRLENKNGSIKAVSFSEDELETVERRNIEVR